MTDDPTPSRRPLLRSLGALALATVASPLVARPAASFQQLPEGDYRALVETACGATADHRRLLNEAAARLGILVSDAQSRVVLQGLTCPVCGCPLTSALPTATAPADPGPRGG